jgi:hypothetical protein
MARVFLVLVEFLWLFHEHIYKLSDEIFMKENVIVILLMTLVCTILCFSLCFQVVYPGFKCR